MVDLDLCYTPATELAKRIAGGDLSPLDVVENSLARIAEVNPTLNCFCFSYPDEALERAHIVVLLADHRAFKDVARDRLEGKLVFDTRGIWR